jgi:glutathione synthase/RimK-type ligase-like ATP-grasp enzyme
MKILIPFTEKRKTLDLIYDEWIKRWHKITLCNLWKIEFRNWKIFSDWIDISNSEIVFFRDIRKNIEEKNLISIYFKNLWIKVFDTRLTKTAANSKIWTWIDLIFRNLPYPKTFSNFNLLDLDIEKQKQYFSFLINSLWNKFIMKPIDWRHWKWVHLISNFEDFIKNHEVWIMNMYQEFIENDWDLRIIVIWWEYIWSILRKGKDGSIVNNVALWWDYKQVDIDDDLKYIAIKTAETLWIEIAWVDIIIDKNTWNPYILEVNRSPEFEWFLNATWINVPWKIFDFLEKQV